MANKILSFSGEHRFLSNFYPAMVEYQGDVYRTSEHAYVAAKTEDTEERYLVQTCDTPGKVKRLGRKLTLRDDWDTLRLPVMRLLLEKKFSYRNPELQRLLLDTGDAFLLEGNRWHDQFWGSCFCGRPACKTYGENHLGKFLMQVREELVRIDASLPKEADLDPKAIFLRKKGSEHGVNILMGVCGVEVTPGDLIREFYDPRSGQLPQIVDGRFEARQWID